MGGFNLTNVLDPIGNQDAATKSYVDALPIYNASYWTGTNYNSSYWTGTNYNSSYWTGTNYNSSYDGQSNYNASYITSTFNATYDAKPSSNYNATYDAKWGGTNYNASYLTSTYNATYDAKTNYNASYWTGTNYNASYITSTYNATYDAKTNYNASYLNKDGTIAMTGNLNLGSKQITSLITGSTGDTAVNKSYVDAVNATGITDHGALTGLTDDDHERYFDKSGTKPITGANIKRDVDNGYLTFYGGTGAATDKGAVIRLYGGTYATTPGSLHFYTPDADQTASVDVMRVLGITDTPFLDMLSHRIAGIAAPTTAGDALIYQAWAAWTPTLVWSSTAPAGLLTVARWTQTGKIVSYVFSTKTTDSDGRSLTTVTLPVAPANIATNIPCASIETSGAAGVTYTNPLAYIQADGSNNKINFRASVVGTIGQFISYEISGSYEVA
jgi:hypothetical protein